MRNLLVASNGLMLSSFKMSQLKDCEAQYSYQPSDRAAKKVCYRRLRRHLVRAQSTAFDDYGCSKKFKPEDVSTEAKVGKRNL